MGAVLPLILSLATIPVYLELITEARFGVLAIAWLILGYFGLFDLGLGRATTQRIAYLGGTPSQETASTFWTALVMNGSLGLLGGAIIWPVALYIFEEVILLDPALQSEMKNAIPWLVLAVPLATISSVLTGALQGHSRFLAVNTIVVTGSSLAQILPLTVAWLYGPDLALLLPAVLLSKVVAIAALFYWCYRHVFGGFDLVISFRLAKNLLGFGGWITLSSIIAPMMAGFDRVVIGATFGAKFVTYYTIPFQLAEKTTILASSLASAIFPRFASANSIEQRQMSKSAMLLLALFTTPSILTAVLFLKPFLTIWIDAEFAEEAAQTGQILLLGFWINGFGHISFAQIQASGRPKVTAILHTIELVPYLALLYLGLHQWGLTGAACAFGLRTLTDTLVLAWLAQSFKQCMKIILVPSFLIIFGFWVTRFQTDFGNFWIFLNLLLVAITAIVCWSILPTETKLLIKRYVRKGV